MSVCADCDWFALEPEKWRTGACLNKWYPDVKVEDKDTYGAYGRTFSFSHECANFVPKGYLKRCKAFRIGESV